MAAASGDGNGNGHELMSLDFHSVNVCHQCGLAGVEVQCLGCSYRYHRRCDERFAEDTATTGTCTACHDQQPSTEDLNSTKGRYSAGDFNGAQNSTAMDEVERLRLRCVLLEKELRRKTLGPGQLQPMLPTVDEQSSHARSGLSNHSQGRNMQGSDRDQANAAGSSGRQNPQHDEDVLSLASSGEDRSTRRRVSWREQVSHLNTTFQMDVDLTVTKEQRAMRKTLDTTLPLFSGAPREWVRFITSYSFTTDACGFKPDENRKRLIESLKAANGAAWNLVKEKLERGGDVESVMQRLVQAFGQPHHLLKGARELVTQLPKLREDLSNLAEFVGVVEDVDDIFKIINRSSEGTDLLMDIEDQLPLVYRREYHAQVGAQCHTLTLLVKYLNNLLDDAIDMGVQVVKKPTRSMPVKSSPGRMMMMHSACPTPNCHGQHALTECKSFQSCPGPKRWDIVKANKRCFVCLGPHVKTECSSGQVCGVDDCRGQHHPLLHSRKSAQQGSTPQTKQNQRFAGAKAKSGEFGKVVNSLPGPPGADTVGTSQSQSSSSQSSSSQTPPIRTMSTMVGKQNATTIYSVVPVLIRAAEKVVKTFAFLDSGGATTLINSTLCRHLGLTGERSQLPLQWADGKTMMVIDTEAVEFDISGTHVNADVFRITAQSMNNLNLPRATVNQQLLQEEELPELVEYFTDEQPLILIGQDNIRVKRIMQSHIGKSGNLALGATPLGWFVEGQNVHQEGDATQGMMFMAGHPVQDKLEQMVSEYIANDNFGLVDNDKVKLESDEVLLAKEILERETVFINGRFETAMLWKPQVKTPFPDNRELVYNRHLKFEKQMAKTAELWPRMSALMSDFAQKRYIRRVHEEELRIVKVKTWYLNIFEELRIQRWTGTTGEVDLRVCDASDSAMAAVSYAGDVGTGHRAIVLAKCRVAPLKADSVTRLEADSCALGVKVKDIILRSNAWKKSWWRWVPAAENLANMATKTRPRDKKDEKDKKEKLWWHGPSFESESRDRWPQGMPEPDEILEVRTVAVVRAVNPTIVPDATNFSKWLDLIRASSLVKVAADIWLKKRNKLQKREHRFDPIADLGPAEEEWGRLQVIRQIQADCRVDQYVKMSPFRGDDGVWRCRGRIVNGEFGREQRFPVILGDHPATRLLISYHHVRGKHQNYFRCVNEIRETYMIPCLRGLANRVIRNCQMCRVLKAAPEVPEMSALPPSRLAVEQPPFSYVGVDVFGPMEVTQLRRRVKRWGILFTCLTTRAVYIELLESMSTTSCMIAIESFLTRRNRQPLEFVSDNGTNFQGAAKELRDRAGMLFKWTFNPPGCPHMGGVWERLIGAAKRALKSVDFSVINKEEELRRALLTAERIINSRPLTEYPTDEDTGVCLTPQDILDGAVNAGGEIEDFTVAGALRAKKEVLDQFWTKWVKEYLPSLHPRSKWHKQCKPMEVGALVYLCDSDVRTGWVRGVVDEVRRDSESNQVREVMVRTATGKRYRRGVHHVAEIQILKE